MELIVGTILCYWAMSIFNKRKGAENIENSQLLNGGFN